MTYKRSGFTLIELLIVIAVIAILAGMLFAAMSAITAKKDKASTKALILTLMEGLEKYEDKYGDYPDTNAAWDSSVLFNALVNVDEPFCEIDDQFIKNEGGVVKIIDTWGRPIYYVTGRTYDTAAAKGSDEVDYPLAFKYDNDTKYHNRTTYILRSFGKNGISDKGKKDDVQNLNI